MKHSINFIPFLVCCFTGRIVILPKISITNPKLNLETPQTYSYLRQMNPVIVRNTEAVVNEKDIQIVKHLSEGLKAAEIATIIGGSGRTVEFRIGRLKGLYHAKTIAHLCIIFKDLEII